MYGLNLLLPNKRVIETRLATVFGNDKIDFLDHLYSTLPRILYFREPDKVTTKFYNNIGR